MPSKGLEFLGAIGRGLKAVAKQNPQSFAVQTPNAASTDILTRYAPYPLQLEQNATVRTLRAPTLHQLDQAKGKPFHKPPQFQFDVENMPPMGTEDTDPLSARRIAAISAMNAKAADDPHFVPRGYYTIWDYLKDIDAHDRNPYGGLTLQNMMRKPAYMQSYLLRKDRVQPQIEMLPDYFKAAELPGATRGEGAIEPYGTWKYPELGHDEERYAGLSLLRQFMESHQTPEERRVNSMAGSYIRGWEQLNHDQQVGALGLSEAGALSTLMNTAERGNLFDKSQWGMLPEWEDTLGTQLGKSTKDMLHGYGIGPATRKRAMLTDWLYNNQGAEVDASSPDAQDFTKNLFYSKGGTVHNPALAGIGKVKTLQHLRSTGSNVMRLAGGGLAKGALRRVHAAGPKFRPVELYAPIDEQAQLLGRSAYRDPQEAARAGLSSSPNTAVAPVLLRRTPGGSGLFNRLPEEGPVELNDPEGYKLGFKKGGLACACGGHR